ncbi:hypothetical protein [Sphingobacterium paludis]|uniref:Uncharacterized protein n=1 Tax=Sphingobacterium paludis TaxID=1476465 RepID=A0A4R7D902_9SPHI|nr:hypothetical protein [Sphingobacterium paludis]TDS17763.1 hypothetical protein B0I21_101637 [Sphingobacterium paludis]
MRNTITKLSNLFKEAVLQGVENVISEEQLFANMLSKNEAYKVYGRSNVDRWLKEKLISISTIGKRGMIDRHKLEQVAACSNRFSYLMTCERK